MEATSNTKFKTLDEYISVLPANTKAIFNELRKIIKQAAPQAEELISYNMPAFKLHGGLVYYAAWKGRIGFYPGTPQIEAAFKKEISEYECSKGTIKFPLNRSIPYDLISKMVKLRVQ